MAVKLRLKRMGSKQKPFYRIVAADARSPRDGRFIETVGTYNPLKNPTEIKVDEEKALTWLNNGAQPTDTVRSILTESGIMKKYADSKTSMELVEFTEYLVKSIVSEPELVKVSSFGGEEDSIILEVIVCEKDRGTVIGKGGKMANAIRTLVQAHAYILKTGKVKLNIDSF